MPSAPIKRSTKLGSPLNLTTGRPTAVMVSSSPESVSEVMSIGPLDKTVSTVSERLLLFSEPSLLRLPARSNKVPLATEMVAVAVESADGEKVAVRVSPVPEMAESVPPVTTTSPVVPSQEKELPGSSEKVKVMVAVSPLFRVDTLLVIVRVGAWVSKVRDGVLPAPPLLPARSV